MTPAQRVEAERDAYLGTLRILLARVDRMADLLPEPDAQYAREDAEFVRRYLAEAGLPDPRPRLTTTTGETR